MGKNVYFYIQNYVSHKITLLLASVAHETCSPSEGMCVHCSRKDLGLWSPTDLNSNPGSTYYLCIVGDY